MAPVHFVGWALKWSSLNACRRASISSISAFLPMKAFSAFDRFLKPVAEPVSPFFRRAFLARSSWRGVVIGFRRVGIVVASGELYRPRGMDVRSAGPAYQRHKTGV